MGMPLLEAKLGAGRVLAREADWGLYVLNSSASMLWELHSAGWDAEGMASLLSQGFGLDGETALRQIESMLGQWRQAGLIGTAISAMPRENQAIDLSDPPPPNLPPWGGRS